MLPDQQVSAGRSLERAGRAREAAGTAKDLSAAVQLEFDFFGRGNVSIAFQYQGTITERLFAGAKSGAQAKEALSFLWTICRHMGWQTHTCDKTASPSCEIIRTRPSHMATALKLLDDVDATWRVKRGLAKVIAMASEGAFRGDANQHGERNDG